MTQMAGKRHAESEGIIVSLQPNDAQRKASDPNVSVWVGASAGSGKTKVLADRVIRLLLSGVKPERILCLTFTRAAAAEMAIRITQQLSRWATCPDDNLRKDLDDLQNEPPEPEQMDEARRLFAKVLSCPGGMRIHTIHAFGQEVLRRFPLEAGLSPHFTVLEEADAQELWHDAQNDVLETAAELTESPEGQALQALVQELGEHKFSEIMREATQDVPRLKEALHKAGGLKSLVALMRSLLSLGPDDTEWTVILSAVQENAFSHNKLFSAARLIYEKGSPKYRTHAQTILDWLDSSAETRAEKFERYKSAFFNKDGTPHKAIANKNVLSDYPEIEKAISQETTRLTSVLEQLDTVRMAEQTAAFLTLAVALIDRYAERKNAQAALDYDDLIRRTKDLVQRPDVASWVLYKLDGGLDHILVDEAQDTSPDQWRIIAALAEEFFSGIGSRSDDNRTLFIVGDEKQSIFSFLKADPDEFARMNAYFRERITGAEKNFDEVPLNISFRSTPAVLKAVDAVFADHLAREGVSHEEVHHFPYHREAAGCVEVWPLVPEPEKKKEGATLWNPSMQPETEVDPIQDLSEQIAEQIEKWIEDGVTVFDRKARQNRPLTYGDIMILVRRRRKIVDPLVRALKARNIPVTGVDRMRLTNQLAVMDLMAILQFVLLSEDDLTLATVLRGPLLGCTEEQLMDLAIGRSGTLWQSLQEKTGKNPSFVPIRDYLQRTLAAADKVTPFAMLARLLNEPCPADAQSGWRAFAARLGPDAEDPIDELLNAAQAFSHRHTPSLQRFIHWLMASEVEIKREMDQGAGRVRITTVHSAKGLEAPIVILPDTASMPRPQDLPRILWYPEHHVPFYVPREILNGMVRSLREQARQKQLEEYRRLLYVALTRASDRLYVTGWGEAKEGSWYNLICKALKPLHDPLVEKGKTPGPIIAFADSGLPAKLSRTQKKKEMTKTRVASAAALPDWIYRGPPVEPKPPRPLVPSRPAETEPALVSPQDTRFARGKIIHRLLQSLPDVDPARQEDMLARFLSNPQLGLANKAQVEIGTHVLKLLRDPAFAPLFGPDSRAEVPIVGHIGDHYIAGQVDRLCVKENAVWILDYKTNRSPPSSVEEVPNIYRRQLAAYCSVLKEIYPLKKVWAYLLWTDRPSLMRVSEKFLAAS